MYLHTDPMQIEQVEPRIRSEEYSRRPLVECLHEHVSSIHLRKTFVTSASIQFGPVGRCRQCTHHWAIALGAQLGKIFFFFMHVCEESRRYNEQIRLTYRSSYFSSPSTCYKMIFERSSRPSTSSTEQVFIPEDAEAMHANTDTMRVSSGKPKAGRCDHHVCENLWPTS